MTIPCKLSRVAVLRVLGAALWLPASLLQAADVSSNASRDALRMVACMQALDANCANSMMYTKMFEDHGVSRRELEQGVAELYRQLKQLNARYARFDLGAPWKPFVAKDRLYIYVPYNQILETRGTETVTQAFFIGVSDNSGKSWKFIDAQKATPNNMPMLIPGYVLGPLPPSSFRQTPTQ